MRWGALWSMTPGARIEAKLHALPYSLEDRSIWVAVLWGSLRLLCTFLSHPHLLKNYHIDENFVFFLLQKIIGFKNIPSWKNTISSKNKLLISKRKLLFHLNLTKRKQIWIISLMASSSSPYNNTYLFIITFIFIFLELT